MQNDFKLIENLQKIGLNDKSAVIYESLLKLGGAYPSKIAEITKINRSTVYRTLTELAIKGLVNGIERKNKIYYQIEQPKKLIRFVDTQIKLAEERKEKMEKILPDIEGLFSFLPQKPKILYFDGIDGIKQVYEDHLTQKEKYEMLGWSNVSDLQDFLSISFLKKYVEKKQKQKITTRGIFPDTDKSRNYNKTIYKNINRQFIPKVKFVPIEKFTQKSEITVYGNNKISIVNFHESSLIGIIVEDKGIYEMMKMIFELSWNAL